MFRIRLKNGTKIVHEVFADNIETAEKLRQLIFFQHEGYMIEDCTSSVTVEITEVEVHSTSINSDIIDMFNELVISRHMADKVFNEEKTQVVDPDGYVTITVKTGSDVIREEAKEKYNDAKCRIKEYDITLY